MRTEPRGGAVEIGPQREECAFVEREGGAGELDGDDRPQSCPLTGGGSRAGFQHELLRAPIQQLGDVELVLRGARELVDPTEFTERLADTAEIAQHLAV